MSLEVELLHRVESLERIFSEHTLNHPLEAHDHLLDHEEHLAHHHEMEPKENRKSERRGGERRTSTEKYEGEERRSA
jgi:hypothetical protein